MKRMGKMPVGITVLLLGAVLRKNGLQFSVTRKIPWPTFTLLHASPPKLRKHICIFHFNIFPLRKKGILTLT
jgi:hypothetical protein